MDPQTAPVKTGYAMVNATWPEIVPPLTYAEAVKAARVLIRAGLEGAPLATRSNCEALRKRKWKFQETSGNRHTWTYGRTWRINVKGNCSAHPGWEGLVHSISHWCHARVYPDKRAHTGHAIMEKRLIEIVLDRGWLDGRLKAKEKSKPVIDKKTAKLLHVQASIKRWQSKQKRAVTALTKLRRQQAYYEKHQ
jgi:hypothetical protein